MQTKKKLPARNVRELASPKVSRPQRKVSEDMRIAEKKVSELITSSARKQRFVQLSAGIPQKQSNPITTKNFSTSYVLARDETEDICLGHDAVTGNSIEHKGCNEETAQSMLETIFSPAFHIPKDVGGGVANEVDFFKFFSCEDKTIYQERGIDGSQIDMLNSRVNLDTSVSVGKDGPVPTVYSSEMELDSNMSSEPSDVQKSGDHQPSREENAMNAHINDDFVTAHLSSDVSAIYLAMRHSELECVDEPQQDSSSTEVCVETDDGEEIDYFDPYLFIKNLPDLSSVVPTFRPMLLPKQTRSCPPTSLVLDLDETLVHSMLEPVDDADFTFPVNFNLMKHTVYVRCRPHLMDFMERVASLFEIIIFTASQSIYAEQLLNVLDPKRRIFRHRVYRDSCVFVEGNYLKDLSVLGRDLAHVIIVDNSPQAFGFQVDNGIPIESWFDDRSDQELLLLLPFLETLVGVEDVRPMIAKKFNLREKVAAAVYPSLNSNKGDPFER